MPLLAGQAIAVEVSTPPIRGEARVPVLWGLGYSPVANPLQAILEDLKAYVRMRDFRGRGALYTNFVTSIDL